eukprot:2738442-Pyramimonas_sp.AAC.1
MVDPDSPQDGADRRINAPPLSSYDLPVTVAIGRTSPSSHPPDVQDSLAASPGELPEGQGLAGGASDAGEVPSGTETAPPQPHARGSATRDPTFPD